MGAKRSGDPLLRNPITGIAACWARAVSGHAAPDPANSFMKSRRLTCTPKGPVGAWYQRLQALGKG
jgi:hypothetical protein